MLYMLHTILISILYRKKPTGCFLTTFLTVNKIQTKMECTVDQNCTKEFTKIHKLKNKKKMKLTDSVWLYYPLLPNVRQDLIWPLHSRNCTLCHLTNVLRANRILSSLLHLMQLIFPFDHHQLTLPTFQLKIPSNFIPKNAPLIFLKQNLTLLTTHTIPLCVCEWNAPFLLAPIRIGWSDRLPF